MYNRSLTRSNQENQNDLLGHTLEQVSNAKYLGIEINETLSWNTEIDRITAKKTIAQQHIYTEI